MKRIDAQWVFLFILMLWIPVLAFGGYEVDGVMYSGPPVPEPSEHGIMFWIYGWGVVGCLGACGIIALILTVGGLQASLKFQYHLYVTHGQFAFWTVDTNTQLFKNRLDVAKTLKLVKEDTESEDTELTFVCWWPVLIIIGIVWIVGAIASFLWPVVLFLGLPFFLIRSIAFKKRKKQVFVDKIKDNDTNGFV